MKRALAIGLLALSGTAGLVYEVCWIRRASLVFGSNTHSLSTVLAIFFAGLALGSWIFGGVSRRTRHPLRLFAALELSIAVLALATLPLFGFVDGLYGRVFRGAEDSPLLLSAARAGLVAAILLPPTVLMGGTLPLFCRALVVAKEAIGRTVALLYGVNTFGAALGCAAAGFLLIPELGLTWSVRVAAALNVLAGLGALSLRAPAREQSDEGAEGSAGEGAEAGAAVAGGVPVLVPALFFATGLIALGLEVLWARYLSLLIHNTVYTYTLTLTAVLVGIVLGSLIGALFLDRTTRRARLFGALQIALGLVVLATVMTPPAVWQRAGEHLGIYFAILLPPAVLSGLSFPLAVLMVTRNPALAGLRVGQMAAANTLGGITGSLAVGFVALPALGIELSLVVLTGFSLAVGLVAWWRLDEGGGKRSVAVAVGCLSAWIAIPLVFDTDLPADFLGDPGSVVDYREGLESNLAVVTRDDDLHLEIDRWWQGRSRKGHQIMAAHTPMLLHPGPDSVLVVGVGVGQTCERFLMYDVERLDCVDIEPSVFDFVREHFDSAWMHDPRVTLIGADGRNYLAHTEVTYDVVSLELGQISRPGVASFYTREFYRDVRARLEPGGLVSQFVPLAFLEPELLRLVVGTFLEVFPQSTLWYNTSELLLIGANADRFELDRARLELLQAEGPVNADLRHAHWGGPRHWLNRPEVFEGGLLVDPEGLRELAGDVSPLSDDRPVLEYATWAVREREANELPTIRLLEQHLAPLERPEVEALRQANLNDMEAAIHLRQFHLRKATTAAALLLPVLQAALAANSESVEALRLMAWAMLDTGRIEEAEGFYARALTIRPGDTISNRGMALVLQGTGRLAQSIPYYKAALRSQPNDAEAHNNLAIVLAQLGDLEAAIRHFEQALELRPGMHQARTNLELARRALAGA